MRFVDEMVEYCTASTLDCLHEQLSLAREALVSNEEKLDKIRQEAEEEHVKMVLKVQELEVKLQESEHKVQSLRQVQASWGKTLASFAALFVFAVWCVLNYPNQANSDRSGGEDGQF